MKVIQNPAETKPASISARELEIGEMLETDDSVLLLRIYGDIWVNLRNPAETWDAGCRLRGKFIAPGTSYTLIA